MVVKISSNLFIPTGILTLFLPLGARAATCIGPEAGAAHKTICQVRVFTTQSLIAWFFGSGQIADARRAAG